MGEISVVPWGGIREPFCSLSHLAGAVLFTVVAVRMVQRSRGDWLRVVSLILMAFVTVQMLVISTLYHMSWPGPQRELFLRLDVAGIFLVISGSMTPVHIILSTGRERWIPVSLIWAAALGGATLRMMYFDHLPGVAGIGIFLAFGWAGGVTAVMLWLRYGWKFIRGAVYSGLLFTLGAIVLLMRSPHPVEGIIGPHEIWHLAVLSALGMHWWFVFQFASGELPVALEPILLRFPRSARTTATAPRKAA